MREISEDTLNHWVQVYILGVGKVEDLHQEFAEHVGLERQDAKGLCYEIMYSVPFLRELMDDSKPLIGEVSRLKGLLASRGGLDE